MGLNAEVVCGENAYKNSIHEVCLESIDAEPVAVYLNGEREDQSIRMQVTASEIMDMDVYRVKLYVYYDGGTSELEVVKSTQPEDGIIYIDGTVYENYDLSANLYNKH